jgi:ABC-type antimicrobial peptide transport system permease subunit
MLRNYTKIAFRNLVKNKSFSFINIVGLASGMAVAILIGLWIYDELSFNKYHQHYDRIAQVMQNDTRNGETNTSSSTAPPLAAELRSLYGSDFKHVVMSSFTTRTMVTSGDKSLLLGGSYAEPEIISMLTLTMRKGSQAGLQDPYSVILSESAAKALFGDADPVDKSLKLDNRISVKVTGVYEDLPRNSSFNDLAFIAPWRLYTSNNDWIRQDDWGQNGFRTYVQLADHADVAKVSAKIKQVLANRFDDSQDKFKLELFLSPMSDWHLYSEFENGVNVGGRIQFVWLYGVIGAFVLLLACINFMNLTTARSEKRAKEVGIRKAIGSLRSQLAMFAFVLSLIFVQLMLPFFNGVADKRVSILWTSPGFWAAGILFSIVTGFVAGSYPAFYLSSFQPIKVLKGTFRVGRFAAIPRKVLVVLQFTVSIALIIGITVVFRQIQFAKSRPVGYTREGLVMVETPTSEIHDHLGAVRDELKKSGVVSELSESLNQMTDVSFTLPGYDWTGKAPGYEPAFATVWVDHEFGKTVGWQFKAGRDFSRAFSTDSVAMVINETAVKQMGLKNPIGETIRFTLFDQTVSYKVVGVIKDMLMESPYDPVRPTVFMINSGKGSFVNVRINPNMSARESLSNIEAVFKKYNPASVFEYKFVDQEYARKFNDEERIGKLATFFTILAILISCMGIFGLSSFIAEQRTKEIGVRKALGASVMSVLALLALDFIRLVLIAFLIAAPIAYFFMNNWLRQYTYHDSIPWWVFAATVVGVVVITLLTVSYQAMKAALLDPVKSLRSE